MQRDFILDFISQNDFEKHVKETLKEYEDVLGSINLKAFNKNIIDPIKLLFDKSVFNKTFEEIIALEIHRQRDKSNNNSIGYFHQNIFKYINGCEVPEKGWDIIFKANNNLTYYVELKNKHNTMNSSSASKTFMKMQNHLLNAKDRDESICALVEVIAKKSNNTPWVTSIDYIRQSPNERLRRISIDKFYEIVTGDKEAFKKLCIQLPITIEKLIKNDKTLQVEKDTVFEELQILDDNILVSLFKLAFSTYEGFENL